MSMLISASQIISKSITLYRENSRLFLSYLAFLLIPNLIFASMAGFSDESFQGTVGSGQLVLLAVVGIVVYIFMLVVSLALMRILYDRYEGRPAAEPKVGIKQVIPTFWPVVWTIILSAIAILCGFILFIIPGIIFSIWFSFSIYATLFDGQKGGAALKASKHLVQGRWFAVLWRLVAPAFVFGIVLLVLQFTITAVGGFFGYSETSVFGSISNVIVFLLSVVLSVFTIPLSTGASIILYSELKKTAGTVSTSSDKTEVSKA